MNSLKKTSNSIWQAIESYASKQSKDVDTSIKHKKGQAVDDSTNSDLLPSLNACLLLNKQYRDQIRQLIDAIGGAYSLHHVAGNSSGFALKKNTAASTGNVSNSSSRLWNVGMSPAPGIPCKWFWHFLQLFYNSGKPFKFLLE